MKSTFPRLILFLASAISMLAQNAATTVQVDANANQRAISPNIYGINYGDAHDIATLNAPLNRWGGNATTRYNWQIDAHSAASDWYFETYSDGSGAASGSADQFVTTTRSAGNGAEPLFTIPMIDYLANLGTNRSTLEGFSVKKYGAQAGTDPYNSDAGNGVSKATGNNLTGNNPLDTGVANSAAIQQAWVQHFVNTFGSASTANGIKYYILDNEPSLWRSTHRDVHPAPLGYDELYNKIVAYSTAIRAADSNAIIAGPEEWGWWAMYYSGVDQVGGTGAVGSDYNTHNQTYYYPWLLQQIAAYKQQTGQQLIDVLTVHSYNDGPGDGDDTTSQLARNKQTRLLWDSNFTDPFWYGDIGINGRNANYIPTLKAWIAQYAPGLKLGFTEYNWGDEANLNGATTQADVLGIYGREGVDLATRWTVAKDTNTTPTTYFVTYLASQIYRNYDGAKSTFGDTSVAAAVANPDNLSAFAAVRSNDHALTVMVINKQTGTTPVTVNLANFAAGGAAQVWQINSAAQTTIAHLANVPVSSNAISLTVPSQSITLFVVPAAPTTARPWDFNADGTADLLWTNTSTGERYLWLMKSGALNSSVFLGVVGTAWLPAVGDFNGDGKADILWTNTSTGERYLWLMNGGTITSSVFLGLVGTAWSPAVGDFNGDGKADILWTNTSTGERYVWLMNGGTITSSVFVGLVGTAWSPVVGDFNGDGKADILWTNTSTGERYVWLMNGGSITSSVFLGLVSNVWSPVVGDFDGNGKTDILWTNTSTGERYVWLMNGGSITSSVFLGLVATTWTPLARDVDGDGKADIVWTNSSTGERYAWLMNGGTLASSVYLGSLDAAWRIDP
jgi:hypothetical protein